MPCQPRCILRLLAEGFLMGAVNRGDDDGAGLFIDGIMDEVREL